METQLKLQILYQDDFLASGSIYQEMVTMWVQDQLSYYTISQDTTAIYKRNRNHLKPRQVPDTPVSITTTVPQEDTLKDEQATFTLQTNDSFQTNEETCTTMQCISSISTKGILPKHYRLEQ